MTWMRKPPPWHIAEAAATPERIFRDRRRIIASLGLGTLAASSPWPLFASDEASQPPSPDGEDPALRPALGNAYAQRFPAPRDPRWSAGPDRSLTPAGIAGRTNNFYELTPAKERVWELARDIRVDPWTVEIRGAVRRPRTFDLDDLFAFPLEERVYRLRCVERWAMQVPWTGFPLRSLLDQVEPLGSARWVRFVSIHDPETFPGQKRQSWYSWPYYEALRLDEARHELTFVTLGIYGHSLPMQHGAPLRLAVPWKYGFKSPKSIVRIELLEDRPGTFWNDFQPTEYGFFSNVDPTTPHPRWSQEWEKDIGTGVTRRTLPFNGYGEQVASLYRG